MGKTVRLADRRGSMPAAAQHCAMAGHGEGDTVRGSRECRVLYPRCNTSIAAMQEFSFCPALHRRGSCRLHSERTPAMLTQPDVNCGQLEGLGRKADPAAPLHPECRRDQGCLVAYSPMRPHACSTRTSSPGSATSSPNDDTLPPAIIQASSFGLRFAQGLASCQRPPTRRLSPLLRQRWTARRASLSRWSRSSTWKAFSPARRSACPSSATPPRVRSPPTPAPARRTWRRCFTARRSTTCAGKSSGSTSGTRWTRGTSCSRTPTKTRLRTRRIPTASSIHGFFYVAPAQDSFMLRMRVPGAVLTAAQMRGIADMAEDWGAGRADLTTRSNVQIRELQPKHLVPVLNKIAALGMSSRGSGADNIRNITASPLSGIDPQSLLDVRPYRRRPGALHPQLARPVRAAAQVQRGVRRWRHHLRCRRYQRHRLPGCARRRRQEPARGRVFPRRALRHHGHRQFATDAGVILKPHEAVAVAAAMIRVFADNGERTDRKKARLKYLVDRGASPGSCKRRKSCSPFRCCGSPRWTASRADPSIAPATSASMLRCSRGSRTWAWWCRSAASRRSGPRRRGDRRPLWNR